MNHGSKENGTMKLYKNRRIDRDSFSASLCRELKLDWSYKKKIEDFIIENGYRIYKEKIISKPNPIFRLTIPFYIILFVLMVIWMPLKWLVTGNWYYDTNGTIYLLFKKWQEKLGL